MSEPRRPQLLDLFCGAGGAAMGYHRAGFDVVGVDIRSQPRYPFPFVQWDALDYARHYGGRFDAIHASPPCQCYSKTRKILEGKGLQPRWSALIGPTRQTLRALDVPYVIENVPGAPLEAPLLLCGTMFGLRVLRHRLFESSEILGRVTHLPHQGGTNSHRGYSRGAAYVTVGGHNYNAAEGKQAMGIGWMTRDELNEAIPPAYTEYVGRQLLATLTKAVA